MTDDIYKEVKDRVISPSTQLFHALQLMDRIKKKLLFVIENTIFKGVISLGDIQRAIIDNIPLETSVSAILREDYTACKITDSYSRVRDLMLESRIECMPILDSNKRLKKVFFWEDLFAEAARIKEDLNLPVVIMAGGKGTRLKPLTNVIPKPLIPIGNKTVVEMIMDKFVEVGCKDFFMSINYKADTIKHYFNSNVGNDYNINYFEEIKPLGTAGSLSLLKGVIESTFFVSNCDIIVDSDYTDVLDYHKSNKNELTIVSALKNYSIPYGTLKTKENGVLTSIEEKPDITFQINTGFYILEPHLLNEVPDNKFFHITELIDNIKLRNGKIGVFPISEKSWIDIGEWNLYLKNINVL